MSRREPIPNATGWDAVENEIYRRLYALRDWYPYASDDERPRLDYQEKLLSRATMWLQWYRNGALLSVNELLNDCAYWVDKRAEEIAAGRP